MICFVKLIDIFDVSKVLFENLQIFEKIGDIYINI